MARIARVMVPGHPHHVTQRGNRRQQTFFGPQDYQGQAAVGPGAAMGGAYLAGYGRADDPAVAASRSHRSAGWRGTFSQAAGEASGPGPATPEVRAKEDKSGDLQVASPESPPGTTGGLGATPAVFAGVSRKDTYEATGMLWSPGRRLRSRRTCSPLTTRCQLPTAQCLLSDARCPPPAARAPFTPPAVSVLHDRLTGLLLAIQSRWPGRVSTAPANPVTHPDKWHPAGPHSNILSTDFVGYQQRVIAFLDKVKR
jgi:hypothetical protein